MQIILFLLEIISPNPPFDKLLHECSFNQTQNVVCMYSWMCGLYIYIYYRINTSPFMFSSFYVLFFFLIL